MSDRDESHKEPFDWGVSPESAKDDSLADAIANAGMAAEGEFASVSASFATSELPDFSAARANDTGEQRVPAGAAGFDGVGEAAVTEPAKNTKLLWWVTGGLVALVVVVALFFFGSQIPKWISGGSATPTPTAAPTPTGPAGVGTWAWNELYGGECIDPFTDAWQQDFTVVDCAAEHHAQLVYRGTFEGDGATVAFPGEQAVGAQINALCTQNGVFDTTAASAYSDLQVQGSYPVTAEQWDAGMHDYYCFVSRAGGEPMTGSVAGPGPK